MNYNETNLYNTNLGIIALNGCNDMATKINNYLVSWCDKDKNNNYLIDHVISRFGTGEGKAVLNESVRGKDIYIIIDVCNYSIEYMMVGQSRRMSPDDHYQDLKRIIAAISGKAKKITVN